MQHKIAHRLAYHRSGIGWFNQKVWHARASFLTKGNVTVALKNTHSERLCDSPTIYEPVCTFISIQVHLKREIGFHFVSVKQAEENTANERRKSIARLTI